MSEPLKRASRARLGAALAVVAAACVLGLGGCGSELGGAPPGRATDVPAELELEPDSEVETPDVLDGDEDLGVEGVQEVDIVDPDTSDTGIDAGPDEVDDVDATPPGPCDGLHDGDPCDDADACTLGDRCTAGRCLPTEALDCDDGNVCTDDTCLADRGCVRLHNLAACDDGDPCTTRDRCSVGICRPGAEACDDRNPCTRDLCSAAGACTNVPDDALPCEDASACTSGDFCAGGVCVGGLGDGCAESDPCVSVMCADDGLSCALELLDGVGCDDGDACTTTDTCQGGLCRAGPALKCPWDSECAAFRCERLSGCILDTTYQAGKSCSDDDRCTFGDKCDGAGVCAPLAPAACDDANPCTEDSCDATWGCEHSWVAGPCDDASACTIDDVCEFGQCRGKAIPCDDGDACTADSCDPLLGCQRVALVCDDHNGCTTDTCDRALGCRYSPRAGGCDDGLACTVLDTCVAGVCTPGAVTCDDADPCTADVCDAEEGCLNVPIEPCPIGVLSLAAVGANASPTGVGQWIAIANASDRTFDLDGYAIYGERCDCEARIDESVELGALTVFGLHASAPAPQPSEIAPGGPGRVEDFDFEFGLPGDGFYIDASGDVISLVGPGGAVVATFVVSP